MTNEEWFSLKPGDQVMIIDEEDNFYGAIFKIVNQDGIHFDVVPRNNIAVQTKWSRITARSLYCVFEKAADMLPDIDLDIKPNTKFNRISNL